jgi:flagellar motor switch/type III secretory pathway protein FliN
MPETELAARENPVLPEAAGWGDALNLHCQVTFGLPIPNFTVRDLLQLGANSVIDTGRPEGTDIAFQLNGQLIGWAEFEAVGQELAFRLTELVGE